MKRSGWIAAFLLWSACAVLAQKSPRFEAKANMDTILLGHYFQLSFVLENANGKNFSLPELDPGWERLSGLNTSSSMSIINGESSQKTTYGLLIRPNEVGTWTVPPATVEVNGKKLHSEPLTIVVVPNPEGLPQPSVQDRRENLFRMDFDDFFDRGLPAPSVPKEEPKKKRPTVKT